MGSTTVRDENRKMLLNVPWMVIWACIALILFNMPLHIDIELKHVFNTAKELLFGKFLVFALVAWASLIFLKNHILIPKTKAFYFYALVILYMLISTMWSTSSNLSFREFAPQLGCFIMFWITVTTIRSEKSIQHLISVTLVAGTLVTMYGLAQYYNLDDHYFQIRVKTEVVSTFVGDVTVKPGQSPISRILPLPDSWSATFFQRLLLPQKPDENFKIYALMGHRNYFSGYLVLLIPLVLIRFVRKMEILLDKDFFKERLSFSFDILLSFYYGITLVLMANAVLLTQTRGAMLGCAVSLCFFLLCSLFLANRRKKKQVVLSIVVGLGLTGFLLYLMFALDLEASAKTNMFKGILGFTIFYFLFLLFRFKQLASSTILIIAFIVIGLGTAKVTFAPKDSSTIQGDRSTLYRITQTTDWKGSAHQRSLIYSTTLRIITDGPFALLFGKGVGTFGIHYMKYQVQLFLDTEASGKFLWDTNKSIYAHNEYIHWWSELGIFGLLLMFAFWHYYIKRVLGGLLRVYHTEHKSNPLKTLTILALLSGTVGTLTHCIVTFDLHLMYSMVTFYCWIAFALALVGVENHKLSLGKNPGAGISIIVLSFIIAIMGIIQINHIYQRDVLWRKAFYEFSRKNWKGAFNLYQEALQHDSSFGELLFDFGRAMMDSNNNPRIKKSEIDKFNILTIKRNLTENTIYKRDSKDPDVELTDSRLTNNWIAVSAFLEATDNFTDPANFHNIALCFYKESQQQKNPTLAKKSEDYYQKAIDLNPIYAQSLSNLGYLKALRGEHDEAKSMLERAVRLKDGRTPTTYLGLAVIYKAKKQYDKALEMFESLVKKSPNNSQTIVEMAILYQQESVKLSQVKGEGAADALKKSIQYKLNSENYFFKAASVEKNPTQAEKIKAQGLQLRIQRLQTIVKATPNDVSSFMQLAFSFVQYGTLKLNVPNKANFLGQGIQALRNLITRDPNNIEARLTLLNAYQVTGDSTRVKESLENILKIMPANHPQYANIVRKLQLFRMQ
ncbi:MAG: tetratricopeptide repeat protein [Candidatus Cloacimonetes bacterium]|nr:tetratricopeptide repeat protein [Candidatus Cloacimonadota bacterium]